MMTVKYGKITRVPLFAMVAVPVGAFVATPRVATLHTAVFPSRLVNQTVCNNLGKFPEGSVIGLDCAVVELQHRFTRKNKKI